MAPAHIGLLGPRPSISSRRCRTIDPFDRSGGDDFDDAVAEDDSDDRGGKSSADDNGSGVAGVIGSGGDSNARRGSM
jgi:hypothetical protein